MDKSEVKATKQKNQKKAEEKKGVIFDIQRYNLHDGPGIRTLVFIKGCPLRCLWCDNPESQQQLPEIAEFENKCIGCDECFKVCPTGSLRKDEGWYIDRNTCINCGKCAKVCPTGARTMIGKEVTVSEVIKEVKKDIVFYNNSGGGVTITGGEPTTQLNFVSELLKACRKNYIHTAMETCGYVEWDKLEFLLTFTDLVLFDLKEMDPEKHRAFTGKSNEIILKNIREISRRGYPMIIRILLVPGYNDDEENIHSTALFLKDLPHPPKVELLLYHQLGINKYKALGRKYSLTHINSLTREHIEKVRLALKSHKISVKVHSYNLK